MVHWLVKYMWEGYTSESKIFRGHEEKIIYSDETNSCRKETQADLERLKVYLDEEWNKIADDDDYLYREKKAAETSAIADKQKKLEEKEDENKIRLQRFQQIKTIRELIEVIDRALTRGSYGEVLKIPHFPVSSRLVSLSNCFIDDKVDLSGEEAWLFRNIPEFVELGKPNIKTNKIYENLNPAHYYFPYVSSLLKEYLRRIIYIGPLREYPERVYSYSGNIPKTVGKAGKYTPDILKKRPDLVDKVNEWFKRFEIDYVLSIDDLKGKNLKGDLFALSLTDTKTDTKMGCKVSLKDVGFGIGQLLPILVQGALSENKIMLIEQPEIHLHPRLQAELGSFIAEMAGRTRLDASWGPALNPAEEVYGNQFIIETHSENLILRIQKLIRKGDLKKEDVAVIYCDKTTDGTVATELRLNDKGEFIDPWPHGFFEESFDELFGE